MQPRTSDLRADHVNVQIVNVLVLNESRPECVQLDLGWCAALCKWKVPAVGAYTYHWRDQSHGKEPKQRHLIQGHCFAQDAARKEKVQGVVLGVRFLSQILGAS